MAKIAGLNSSQNMFRGQRKDFIVMRKDTFSYTGTYTYYDSNSILQTYDFTDCIGKMDIKRKKYDTKPLKIVAVSFDVTEYNLFISEDDLDLDAGRYYYDLQIEDADGNMVTKLYGDFKVLQDVTDFELTIRETVKVGIENEITFIRTTNEDIPIKLLSFLDQNANFFNKTTITKGMSSDITYVINMMPRTTINFGMITDVSYLRPSNNVIAGSINSDIFYTIYELD